jgi:DNA-binding NtrC family response regulator
VQSIPVDVRVIAASKRDLRQLVAEGRFRDDLYYRLNVLPVTLPPLRDRREDIPALMEHFLAKSCPRGQPVPSVTPAIRRAFVRYSWPGNIRELENTIERAVLMAEGQTLRASDLGLVTPGELPPARALQGGTTPEPRSPSAPAGSVDKEVKRLNDIERTTILQVLKETNWVQKDAARLLGVSPRVLNYKIKNHGITHISWIRHRPPEADSGGDNPPGDNAA